VTLRVAIVGPGRAGRSLANAFGAAGIDVVGLIGRGTPGLPLATADVVLVTVRDGDLADALGALRGLKDAAVVLHASGADDPVQPLGALRRAGHPAGTFHPLVPLADPEVGPSVMRGAWIGVDGDPGAVAAAEVLATAIGAHVVTIPAGAKPGYHAAAVIAANFTAVLAAAAEREMCRAGLDPRSAHAAVAHLMRTSIDHVAALGPERGLTGPVVRGDVGTIQRNVAALAGDPAARDLYVAATRIAIQLARAAGTDAERLGEMEQSLHS
jgi:predicted short-subunit dehydrogenase-like oxidoreductase (DUF2520 family)